MKTADLFQKAEEVAEEHDCMAVMAVSWEEKDHIVVNMGRLNAAQNDPRPPQTKALLQRLKELIEAEQPNVVVIAMKRGGTAIDRDAERAIREAVQKQLRKE